MNMLDILTKKVYNEQRRVTNQKRGRSTMYDIYQQRLTISVVLLYGSLLFRFWILLRHGPQRCLMRLKNLFVELRSLARYE